MKDNINSHLESGFFVNIIIKNYKLLIWVSLITAVLASILSSPIFITPKFKSQVVMFPSSSNSMSKALLTEQVGGKLDILQYGEDEQIDQMLQVLNSSKIRDRVVEKFNLIEHYGYGNSSYKYTKLNKTYSENIKFRRTEFMAVSVTVYDKDPDMAAVIANEIVALYDTVCIAMQKERAWQAFQIVEQTYLSLVSDINKMEDSLAVLRSLGVHDYETQSEVISQQLAIQIAAGNENAVRKLQQQLDILAKYGTPYVSIRDQLLHDKRQLSTIKIKYEEAKIDAEQELTQKFIISEAAPAEKKSYPIRWMIVVISTLSVFLMTITILVLVESIFPHVLAATKINLPSKKSKKIKVVEETLENNEDTTNNEKEENNKKKNITSSIACSAAPSKQEVYIIDNKIEEDMKNFFSAKKLWEVLWKRKFHILAISIVGIIVGVVFSSPRFIAPKYKSVAVVYPSNIVSYSDESESEQLYQWLLSTDIKWHIIEKFNLYEHYGITKGSPKSLTYMLNDYNGNVRIEPNAYEAISITVYDSDPQIACDMVNAIIDFANVKIRTEHKVKFEEVVANYNRVYDWSLNNLSTLTKQLETTSVDNNALYMLSKAFGVDSKKANSNANSSIDNFSPEYINEFMQLITMNKSLVDFYDRYNIAYSNLQKEYTYTTVLTSPFPADNKSTPIRWLIVVFSAFAFFLVSYIGFVAAENMPPKKEN